MTQRLHIALAQTESKHDVEDNLATAARLFAQAQTQGAEILVFPEMFMARPRQGVPLAEIAQPVDGAFVSAMTALAQKHGMTVIFGMWEQVPGDNQRAANVLLVLDENGTRLARYQKAHLFDALNVRESDIMLAGNEPPPVFCFKGFNIGLAICYDLRFPELFRYLAHRGAELVLVPAAWYAGTLKEDHWLTLLRARAIENTLYIGGCGLCGNTFSARSAVFDPFGVQLADAGEAENIITAEIDHQRLDAIRRKLPTLTHCRTSIFQSGGAIQK